MTAKWHDHRSVRWVLILMVVAVWIAVAVRITSVYPVNDVQSSATHPSVPNSKAATRNGPIVMTIPEMITDPFDPEHGRPNLPPAQSVAVAEGGPPKIELPDYTLTAIVDETAVIELPGGISIVVRKGGTVFNPAGSDPVRLVNIRNDYIELEFGGAIYTLGLSE